MLRPFLVGQVSRTPVVARLISTMVGTVMPFMHHEIPMKGISQQSAVTANAPEKASALVMLVCAPSEKEGEVQIPKAPNGNLDKIFAALVKAKKFKANPGEHADTLLTNEPFEQGILVGLGAGKPEASSIYHGFDSNKKEHDPFRTYQVGRTTGGAVKNAETAVVVVPPELPEAAKRAFVEGVLIGINPEQRFKGDSKPVAIKTVALRNVEQNVIDSAVCNVHGIMIAKELVDAPPNICNPENLAKFAEKLRGELQMEGQILDRKECEKRGMGAYLAVNNGSNFEPQFIHLIYKPKDAKKKIALIGKGITMDTGGYNIKSDASLIDQMKTDMGGAAAVLGAARIIAQRQPNAEVHFIIAAAENMVSSRAVRPGDVVTASNGKTIVVNNTDAEGRLTLADALVYAEKECAVDAIIDCATLTGALMAGLGTGISGVYGTCDKLMETVLSSGKEVGEAMWPMPLFASYKKYNEFPLVDLSNLPSMRWGGSITATHFLREFVEKTPWVHVDLPGPVYNAEEKFATGYGARFLAESVCRFAQ